MPVPLGKFVSAKTATEPRSKETKIIFMTEIPVEQSIPVPERVSAGHTTSVRAGNSDEQGAIPPEERRMGRVRFGGGSRRKC